MACRRVDQTRVSRNVMSVSVARLFEGVTVAGSGESLRIETRKPPLMEDFIVHSQSARKHPPLLNRKMQP